MSGLRSFVDELRSESLPALPDALVEEDFAELQRAVELLEVERLRRLAEIDKRRLFERDGYLSAASWLATRFKMAWGSARESVRVARSLEEMPMAREALERGDISFSGVKVLMAARDADPEAFSRSEEQLVDAARIHSMNDLGRVAAYWRQAAERERGAEGEDKLMAQRRLHASVSLLGMVRVDGDLDPETGETLLTALGAVLDAEARSRHEDDERTPSQRRADALGEICRQWLDRSERPSVAGERPHVTVTVAADALRTRDEPPEADTTADSQRFSTGGSLAEERARPRGSGGPRDGSADRMRRVVDACGVGGTIGATRRGQAHIGRPTLDAPSGDRARSPLPVPGMRPSRHVVRRAPRSPLGRRRRDGAPQPAAAVPLAAATTGWSTTAAVSGWSCSKAGRCSGARTGRCWRTGLRRDRPDSRTGHEAGPPVALCSDRNCAATPSASRITRITLRPAIFMRSSSV